MARLQLEPSPIEGHTNAAGVREMHTGGSARNSEQPGSAKQIATGLLPLRFRGGKHSGAHPSLDAPHGGGAPHRRGSLRGM